jgi:hypothetical protein
LDAASRSQANLRLHGWLWTLIGSLMLIGASWQGPRNMMAAKVVVLGLGALDVAAGTLVLRRMRAGRFLLIPALTAHLALALWLWHEAQLATASLGTPPSAPMTHQQMIERTAAGAMLGMVVLFEQRLAVVSALLSVWTAGALVRSR